MKEKIVLLVAALLAAAGVVIALVLAFSPCALETVRTDDSVDVYLVTNVTVNTTVNSTSPVNLAFVYDKSVSMLPANILVEQESIEVMIREFNNTLGPGMLQVGVLSFGCFPTIEVNTTTDFLQAIEATHASGTLRQPCTRTDRAFEAYLTLGWPSLSAAADAANVLVLLSDGAVFPPEAYPAAQAEAQAIKGSEVTIISLYVNDLPNNTTAAEMWRFSSCDSEGTDEVAGQCLYFFKGDFSSLEAASSELAQELAMDVAVVADSEEVTITKKNVTTVKSTVKDTQCVYDRRWLLALLLVLPLVVYGCYYLWSWCCIGGARGFLKPPKDKASDVETHGHLAGPAATLSTKMEESAATVLRNDYESTLFSDPENPIGPTGRVDLNGGSDVHTPLPPQQHPTRTTTDSAIGTAAATAPRVRTANAISSFDGESGRRSADSAAEQPSGPTASNPTAAPGAPKSKWATVKTDHYIWSMGGGGATKLKVDFGKGFDASSLPSAPAAVDKTGRVLISGGSDAPDASSTDSDNDAGKEAPTRDCSKREENAVSTRSDADDTSALSTVVSQSEGAAKENANHDLEGATSLTFVQAAAQPTPVRIWGGLFPSPVAMSRITIPAGVPEESVRVADEDHAHSAANERSSAAQPTPVSSSWWSRFWGLFRCFRWSW